MRKLSSAIILAALSASFAAAAPPLKPEFDPGGPTCGINRPALERNALRNMSGIRAQGAPVPLDPAVLVIRVDFSDKAMTLTKAETEAFFVRVRSYFLENSYGVFRPTFTVSDSVHRIGTLATYGADCGSDVACNDTALRIAAVAAEDAAGRNFADFDHVMIYHAGNGQESSGVANDIWSVFLSGSFTRDGQTFEGFTVVPETEAGNVDPLGVICHEYGHQIGLPDLYDVSSVGGSSTVGAWDIMDYPYTRAPGGPLGGNPPHLGAWSKKFLGFISPTEILSPGVVTLAPVETSSVAAQLPILVSDVGSANEYFLIEHRSLNSAATYDKGIPGSGFLIWHIDETIASNATRLSNNDVNTPSLNGKGRRGVDVVEADFTELYGNAAKGEATDAFGASDAFLAPLSNAHNGVETGIIATAFSGIEAANGSFAVDSPAVASIPTSASVAVSSAVASSSGELAVAIPAGTFADGKRVFLAAISATTFGQLGSRSLVSTFEGSSVGCLLGGEGGAQPRRPVRLTLGFSNVPALTGLDEAAKSRLVIARYIPTARAWVPVPTAIDLQANVATADLTHFSLFQLMHVSAPSAVGDARVFPNPIRPALGAAYEVMNFANMAPNSEVKIYSTSGELVKELTGSASGVASWDGNNQSGERVASGVYFAVLKTPSGGDRKILKLAVER